MKLARSRPGGMWFLEAGALVPLKRYEQLPIVKSDVRTENMIKDVPVRCEIVSEMLFRHRNDGIEIERWARP